MRDDLVIERRNRQMGTLMRERDALRRRLSDVCAAAARLLEVESATASATASARAHLSVTVEVARGRSDGS